MLIQHEREKLLQAINYFVRNTRQCGKTKLFKLLYFLDFEHFKITGRSVTGLQYAAWRMGPVPVDLFEELEAPQPDMAEAMQFVERPVRGGERTMLIISPRIQFDDRHFTRRELGLMKQLVDEYRDASADDMIEATHLENMPWDRVYNQQGLRQAVIPYELALSDNDSELVQLVARERRETLEQLK